MQRVTKDSTQPCKCLDALVAALCEDLYAWVSCGPFKEPFKDLDDWDPALVDLMKSRLKVLDA